MAFRGGSRGTSPRRTCSRFALVVAAALCLFLAASAVAAAEGKVANTVFDALSSEPRFSSLVRAIRAADLAPYLRTADGVTVFAPTNDAFERRDGSVDRESLEYHIVTSATELAELTDGRLLQTYLPGPRGGDKAGQRLKVSRTSDGRVFVGNSQVVEGDLRADNGVIHVVDSLLDAPVDLVQTLSGMEGVDVLNTAVDLSGLSDALKSDVSYTLFAPSDRAFEKLHPATKQYLSSRYAKGDLKAILKYLTSKGAYYVDELPSGMTKIPALAEGTHSLMKYENGDAATFDGVSIQRADVIASNGAIHLIEHVLLPPSFEMDAMKHLVGMNYTAFVDLFTAAGLSGYLTSHSPESPVTIFAVPNDHLEGLSKISNDQLIYHIVPGRYGFEDFQDNSILHTELKSKRLNGGHQVAQVFVLDNNGEREVLINDAKVLGTPADVNGATIYTLSHLMELPVDPMQAIITDLDLSTFAAAIHSAKLDRTIRKQAGTTIFVPSNRAFIKDSAVMSYLLLPDREEDLRYVLQYHVATSINYSNDLPRSDKPGDLTISTLAKENITIASSDDRGLAVRGYQQREAHFAANPPRNWPTSNGNIFVVDRLLLPDIDITVWNLLKGLNAPTFGQLLTERLSGDSEVPPLDNPQGDPFTLLVPTEKAFARTNLEELARDLARLSCSIKAHFVRGRAELADGAVWETMCDGITLKVRSAGEDKWELETSASGSRVRIGRRGEVRNGNVYEINQFLAMPESRGLAWYVIVLIVLGLLGAAVAAIALWRYVRARERRTGYQEIPGRE